MSEGHGKAGYAIVATAFEVEAKSLPANASARKAELVALIPALEIAKGKAVNVRADS